MRLWGGVFLVLAGAAVVFRLASAGKPFPYPVAYRFGYEYREKSLEEEAWQERLSPRYRALGQGSPAGVKLQRFYPRYPDTEQGAVQSWKERRKEAPFVYLAAHSETPREPTPEEAALEQEGWVAGYLDSARGRPKRY